MRVKTHVVVLEYKRIYDMQLAINNHYNGGYTVVQNITPANKHGKLRYICVMMKSWEEEE